MNGTDERCIQLQDEIDALNSEIDNLEQALNEVPPASRPGIRRIIAQLTRQVIVLEKQLAECLIPTSNISIVGIELTQAIQFFRFNGQGSANAGDNSVPFVAKKALILRVYVNVTNSPSFPIPASVSGKVSYRSGATTFPDLSPINSPIIAAPSGTINRGNANHTLNFLVPAANCLGTLMFTVTVFDPAHPSDPAYSSKPTLPLSVSFDDVPNVRVHGVLIHYTGKDANGNNTNIAAPSGLDLVNTLVYVGKTYPISGFTYTACDVVDFNGDLTLGGGGGCGTGWNQLFNLLWNMRAASGTNDVYVGLLPAGVPTSGVIGCGGGGVAIAYVGAGSVFAQEIGHAFGRAHAPCGNPGGPDPNYPTYDSYPSGSIGEFGFDPAGSQVFNPASTYDFMSYCGPVWVSPYTYVGLKNAIASSMAAAHPERPEVRDVTREYLHLNFRWHRDGEVEVLPSFHLLRHAPALEVGPLSPFSCHLLSAKGQVLVSHHCHFSDPHQDPDGPDLDFHEVVPWDPETQAIAFLRSGEKSHTIEVKEQPPEVSIQAPKQVERRAELMRVQWSAKQSEKPITYLLRYSYDGGRNWRAVAADLTDLHHVVNLSLLPGGEQCKFQVVATTGIRTAVAETDPFAVPQKPSQAQILSPKPGATFTQGEPVLLLGGGFSPDFETTPFEDLVWTDNLNGIIGVGYAIITNTLPVGQHRITLSCPDGLGEETTANVLIKVKPRA